MYMQVIRISVYNNAALSWGCIIRITNKVQSSVQYLFALFIEKKVVYFTTVFGLCYKDILVFKELIINTWLLLFCFRVSTAVLGTVMAETG